jgi:Na+-transporting NADH:ubiquinone oxidoreductase subunit F
MNFIPVLIIDLILLIITILLAIADRLLVSYGQCKITVRQEEEVKEFTVQGGSYLLADLTANNIKITSSCAGKASCGYCKVWVRGGGPNTANRRNLYEPGRKTFRNEACVSSQGKG